MLERDGALWVVLGLCDASGAIWDASERSGALWGVLGCSEALGNSLGLILGMIGSRALWGAD